MKYMLLLFSEEGSWEYSAQAMAPWTRFEEGAAKMATRLAGDPLQPSRTATVVSVRAGKRIVTDGPFIETKEQLGGYYVFDCDNLDTALKLAEMIPLADRGYIEVRPVIDMPGAPVHE